MIPSRRREIVPFVLILTSLFLLLHLAHIKQESRRPTAQIWAPSRATSQSILEAEELLGKVDDGLIQPANSTLGFGKIIAVSTKNSHRRQTLQMAADLTGLEISIPDQPKWTQDDLNEFAAKNGSIIDRGSAMAWMGHLNALKWFMDQPYDNALIIEDDINWDIHLRTKQIPLVAAAFHDVLGRELPRRGKIESPELLKNIAETTNKEHVMHELEERYRAALEAMENGESDSLAEAAQLQDAKAKKQKHAPAEDEESDKQQHKYPAYKRTAYWPSPEHWEIMYLGHCGDFYPPTFLSEVIHTAFPDPNMPSFQGLNVDTQNFMRPLPIPPRHRLIHQSIRPLCTFAYAINKQSAARILKELGHEQENKGTCAYDVRILEACRDMGWKCWSSNPELFHHMDDQASEIWSENVAHAGPPQPQGPPPGQEPQQQQQQQSQPQQPPPQPKGHNQAAQSEQEQFPQYDSPPSQQHASHSPGSSPPSSDDLPHPPHREFKHRQKRSIVDPPPSDPTQLQRQQQPASPPLQPSPKRHRTFRASHPQSPANPLSAAQRAIPLDAGMRQKIRAHARGTPNIGCGIRSLLEYMGAGNGGGGAKVVTTLRKMVALASEVDGLCPMSMEEVDGLRGQIRFRGRDIPQLRGIDI